MSELRQLQNRVHELERTIHDITRQIAKVPVRLPSVGGGGGAVQNVTVSLGLSVDGEAGEYSTETTSSGTVQCFKRGSVNAKLFTVPQPWLPLTLYAKNTVVKRRPVPYGPGDYELGDRVSTGDEPPKWTLGAAYSPVGTKVRYGQEPPQWSSTTYSIGDHTTYLRQPQRWAIGQSYEDGISQVWDREEPAPWNPTLPYSSGQQVTHVSSYYQANASIPIGVTPGSDSRWTLIDNPFPVAYYQCNNTHTSTGPSDKPPNGSYWSVLQANPFANAEDVYWKSVRNFTADSFFTPSNWTQVGNPFGELKYYESLVSPTTSTSFVVSEWNRINPPFRYYKAKATFTASSPTLVPSDWTEIFDPDQLFAAKVLFTSGPEFNDSDWNELHCHGSSLVVTDQTPSSSYLWPSTEVPAANHYFEGQFSRTRVYGCEEFV